MSTNKCPVCGSDTDVIDSRTRQDIPYLYRRRKCRNKTCGTRTSTYEVPRAEMENLLFIKDSYEAILRQLAELQNASKET